MLDIVCRRLQFPYKLWFHDPQEPQLLASKSNEPAMSPPSSVKTLVGIRGQYQLTPGVAWLFMVALFVMFVLCTLSSYIKFEVHYIQSCSIRPWKLGLVPTQMFHWHPPALQWRCDGLETPPAKLGLRTQGYWAIPFWHREHQQETEGIRVLWIEAGFKVSRRFATLNLLTQNATFHEL